MNVIYDSNSGHVSDIGYRPLYENEATIDLDWKNIAEPVRASVVDDVKNPSQTVIDISLLKNNRKHRIREKAHSLLKPYDWYVIRKQESGTAIPDAVTEYRNAVRDVEDAASAEIEAATTVEEVRAVNPEWPSEPDV